MVIHNASFVIFGVGSCIIPHYTSIVLNPNPRSSCSHHYLFQGDSGKIENECIPSTTYSLIPSIGTEYTHYFYCILPDHKNHLEGDNIIFSTSHYSLLTAHSPSPHPLTIVNNCIIRQSAEATKFG